ncbi:hypothetical protein VTK26DRAFT_5532 [Humicola hyalothermophila]
MGDWSAACFVSCSSSQLPIILTWGGSSLQGSGGRTPAVFGRAAVSVETFHVIPTYPLAPKVAIGHLEPQPLARIFEATRPLRARGRRDERIAGGDKVSTTTKVCASLLKRWGGRDRKHLVTLGGVVPSAWPNEVKHDMRLPAKTESSREAESERERLSSALADLRKPNPAMRQFLRISCPSCLPVDLDALILWELPELCASTAGH